MGRVHLHNWYRQFEQLKAQHPEAILLFRMGDFYEAFGDDAKLLAEVLDLTLARKDYAVDKTQPKSDQKQYCPMAGIPFHAAEAYVARLVSQGYRVAIAEQVSETEASKRDTRPRSVFAGGREQGEAQRGLVHREIVRLLTPGTLTDPTMLDQGRNNYLAAVLCEQDRIGLAYVDLSTGEFAATELAGERAPGQLEGELARLNVAELLVSELAAARPPGIEPATAQLTHDLAPMTRDERDLLLPHERGARRLASESSARWARGEVTLLAAWHWDLATARDMLLRQLGGASLAGFGLEPHPLATRAAGALLHYAHTTQRSSTAQIRTIRVYTTGSFMFLDPQTRRNLELLESNTTGKAKGALLGVIDQTCTPMGARVLRRWLSQPLVEQPALDARQQAVAVCVDDSLLRAELRAALGKVGDMERAVNRVMQGASSATPRDMVLLRQALRALPAVIAAVGPHTALVADAETLRAAEQPAPSPRPQRARGQRAPRVQGADLFGEETAEAEAAAPVPPDATDDAPAAVAAGVDACAEVLALLERALDDDPPALLGASNYLRAHEGSDSPRRLIRPGYDPRMDRLVAANADAQSWISGLESRERARTGIDSLRVAYNKVFGYYIELGRAYSEQVPPDYERKQTLVGKERYITLELKEYEQIVINAQQQLLELERAAFARLCDDIAPFVRRLRATAHTLARVDVFAALAEVAVRGRYVRPTLHETPTLRIAGGRHPVVERTLASDFIANDLTMNTDDQQLLLITGANMAGKSTVLRQVALIVLLAQIGSYVPADTADIGLVDRIFTRIGAQDDIATGRSTFMVEMTETAALLAQSTPRSLIILDEVGRGTSTYDGMAIARAIVEYIHDNPRLRCRTLFATHYHELTDLETALLRVHNYHMAAVEREGRVVFLYELRAGRADRSYGIHVAELAGMPRAVIERASTLLADLEHAPPLPEARTQPAPAPMPAPAQVPEPTPQPMPLPAPEPGQLSLFDVAPSPVIAYLKRLDINALTPLDALMRLQELQEMAQRPLADAPPQDETGPLDAPC